MCNNSVSAYVADFRISAQWLFGKSGSSEKQSLVLTTTWQTGDVDCGLFSVWANRVVSNRSALIVENSEMSRWHWNERTQIDCLAKSSLWEIEILSKIIMTISFETFSLEIR